MTVAAGLLGIAIGAVLAARLFDRVSEPLIDFPMVVDPILCVVHDDEAEVNIALEGFTQRCSAFFEDRLTIRRTRTEGVISGRRLTGCDGYAPFGPVELHAWETHQWLEAIVGYILQARHSDATPTCVSSHGGGHVKIQWTCSKNAGGSYVLNSAACGNAAADNNIYDRSDAISRLHGLLSALASLTTRVAPAVD